MYLLTYLSLSYQEKENKSLQRLVIIQYCKSITISSDSWKKTQALQQPNLFLW